MKKLILISFLSFNVEASELNRILNQAILANDSAAIKQTFQLGVDINQKNASNLYPIHFAMRPEVKPDTLKLLVEYGADVNVINNQSESPLHLAVKNNQPQKAKIILERKANCGLLNNVGKSALHLSVEQKENAHQMTEILLGFGLCDPAFPDRRGFPSLALAVLRSSPSADLVSFLLSNGANKEELVWGKFKALDFAIGQLNYFKKHNAADSMVVQEQEQIVDLLKR